MDEKIEVSIQNSLLLKKSMETISEIVQEGSMIFKKDYLEILALNENNVIFTVFRLLSTMFQEYKIEKERKILINFKDLSNIIKNCDDQCKLKLIVEESLLKICIEKQGDQVKEFDITLIGAEIDLPDIPNLDPSVKFVMNSMEFSKAVKDLSFDDVEAIKFTMNEKDFSVESRTNSLKGKVNLTNKIQILKTSDEVQQTDYSFEYLKKFIKAESIVDNVELNFKSDYPLQLNYKSKDKFLLSFILAPRGDD